MAALLLAALLAAASAQPPPPAWVPPTATGQCAGAACQACIDTTCAAEITACAEHKTCTASMECMASTLADVRARFFHALEDWPPSLYVSAIALGLKHRQRL